MSLRRLLGGVDSLASSLGLVPKGPAIPGYTDFTPDDLVPEHVTIVLDPKLERTVVDPNTPWGKLQKHQRERILNKRIADYHYRTVEPRGYDELYPEYQSLQSSMNPVSGLHVNIDRTYHEPFLFIASNFNTQTKLFQLGSDESRIVENAFGVGYTNGDVTIKGHVDEDKFTGRIDIDVPTHDISYSYERKQTHLPLNFEVSSHTLQYDLDRTRFGANHKSSHSRTITTATATHQFWTQFYLGFKLKLIHGNNWHWSFRGHYRHFHPFIFDHNNYPYPPSTNHTTTVDLGSHALRLRHWHRLDDNVSFLTGVKLSPPENMYFANAIIQYDDWFWGNTHRVEANTYGDVKYSLATHLWGLPSLACKLFASMNILNPLSIPTLGVEFNYETEHRPGYGTHFEPKGFVPYGLPELEPHEYTEVNNQVRRQMGTLPGMESDMEYGSHKYTKKYATYRPSEAMYDSFIKLHNKVAEEQRNLERVGGGTSSISLLDYFKEKMHTLRMAGILPKGFDPANPSTKPTAPKPPKHIANQMPAPQPIDDAVFPTIRGDADFNRKDGYNDTRIGFFQQHYMEFMDQFVQDQIQRRRIEIDVERDENGMFTDPVLEVIGPKLARYYEAFDFETFRFEPPSLFMINRHAKRRCWYYPLEYVPGTVSEPFNSLDEVENKYYWGAWLSPEDVILKFDSPQAIAQMRAFKFWLSVLRFETLLGIQRRAEEMESTLDETFGILESVYQDVFADNQRFNLYGNIDDDDSDDNAAVRHKRTRGDKQDTPFNRDLIDPTSTYRQASKAPFSQQQTQTTGGLDKLSTDPRLLQQHLAKMASITSLKTVLQSTYRNSNLFGSSATQYAKDNELFDRSDIETTAEFMDRIGQMQKEVAQINENNHQLILQLKVQLSEEPDNQELRNSLREAVEAHENNIRSTRAANEILLIQEQLELDRLDEEQLEHHLASPNLPGDVKTQLKEYHDAIKQKQQEYIEQQEKLQAEQQQQRKKKRRQRVRPPSLHPAKEQLPPRDFLDTLMSYGPNDREHEFTPSDESLVNVPMDIPRGVTVDIYEDEEYDHDRVYFRSAAKVARDIARQQIMYNSLLHEKYLDTHPQLVLDASGKHSTTPSSLGSDLSQDTLSTLSTKASLMNAHEHQYRPRLPSQHGPVNITGNRLHSGAPQHLSHINPHKLDLGDYSPQPKKQSKPPRRKEIDYDNLPFPLPPHADDEEYYSSVRARDPTPKNARRM